MAPLPRHVGLEAGLGRLQRQQQPPRQAIEAAEGRPGGALLLPLHLTIDGVEDLYSISIHIYSYISTYISIFHIYHIYPYAYVSLCIYICSVLLVPNTVCAVGTQGQKNESRLRIKDQ